MRGRVQQLLRERQELLPVTVILGLPIKDELNTLDRGLGDAIRLGVVRQGMDVTVPIEGTGSLHQVVCERGAIVRYDHRRGAEDAENPGYKGLQGLFGACGGSWLSSDSWTWLLEV